MSTLFSAATEHSIKRAKERAGINRKKATRNIDLALKHGKIAEDYTARERNYLNDRVNENFTAITFNGFCYIVSDNGSCVTMYPLPNWFGKKKMYEGKSEIRNPYKYSRYCAAQVQ